MKISPLKVRFMLACYYAADPIAELGDVARSPAGIDALAWLHKSDLIDVQFKPTERGVVWVEGICMTPLPEQTWAIHRIECGASA